MQGKAVCHCPDSSTGLHCEKQKPMCTAEYCLNGGQCHYYDELPFCFCAHGYSGPRCENDVDECADAAMCFNGATCVNVFGKFSCLCTAGFHGERCEHDRCTMKKKNGEITTCGFNGTCHYDVINSAAKLVPSTVPLFFQLQKNNII